MLKCLDILVHFQTFWASHPITDLLMFPTPGPPTNANSLILHKHKMETLLSGQKERKNQSDWTPVGNKKNELVTVFTLLLYYIELKSHSNTDISFLWFVLIYVDVWL